MNPAHELLIFVFIFTRHRAFQPNLLMYFRSQFVEGIIERSQSAESLVYKSISLEKFIELVAVDYL